jgi:plasmid replication initiation protein
MSGSMDLFLNSLVNVPLRDDRALMEHPFFSLTKQARFEPIVYEDQERGIYIRVTAGEKGIATIWDKDILIYLISSLNDRLERGLDVSRTITFAAHDMLTVLNRYTGSTNYEKLYDGLFRLRSTTIETTITSDDKADRRGFGWIENWHIEERTLANGRKFMKSMQVTLNDWMFRAIVNERRVLSINERYFRITKGIERRLYELARKHCGNQPSWTVSLTRLAEKCGVARELRKFKADLKEIIERDETPDYRLEILLDSDDAGRAGKGGRRIVNSRLLVRVTPRDKSQPVSTSIDQARYMAESVHRGRSKVG